MPAPVPVPSPPKYVHVAHRGGRKSSFIPGLTGRRAPATDLVSLLSDAGRLHDVALAAHASVRTFVAGELRPLTVPMSGLCTAEPDALAEVRRAVSYVGQPNYAGTVVAPTQSWAWRPAWCESLNERVHYFDVLMSYSVMQMATQCLRLEWSLPGGARSHVPDAFFLLEGGDRLVVDVTTTQRLESPAARAVFALTAATCQGLGWRYEVRSEMPVQRQRNLSFLRCFSSVPEAELERARRRLVAGRMPEAIHELATSLGEGDARAGLGRVWALLATGQIHADLDAPLQPDTAIFAGRQGGADKPWITRP